MSRHVFVTGAGRGVGLALVTHLLKTGSKVWATYRSPEKATELLTLADSHPELTIAQLDVTDAARLQQLAEDWRGVRFDWLINNAGAYGPKGWGIDDIDEQTWLSVLKVNTIAPFQVSRAFYGNLSLSEQPKLAFLSSKVGSIQDNTSGGGYIYRSSKTALNQVIKSLSIDLRSDQICVLALHPGWVKTEMGGPNALISADVSAEGLIAVLELATLQSTGHFLNYDGSQIPW